MQKLRMFFIDLIPLFPSKAGPKRARRR